METANFSLFSQVERLTLNIYAKDLGNSRFLSEVISRLAALILFTPTAVIDFVMHTVMLVPSFLYAVGKSIYLKEADFLLPWQHLQRIRNSVAPIIFGSILGVIHPKAAFFVTEPTDKHCVVGMLSSNTQDKYYQFNTPCSPIDSYSIIQSLDNKDNALFSQEHIQALKDVKHYEYILEAFQAQEWVYKLTNVTLIVMSLIDKSLIDSNLNPIAKEVLLRFSAVLIPILTAVDFTIGLIFQAYLLTTGFVRLFTGSGPIYSEATINPLTHISLITQMILKVVGNIAGTFVWVVNPLTGFKVSLYPATSFFNLEMRILMKHLENRMINAEENSRFVLPIGIVNENTSAISVPFADMHQTYLIVEKNNGQFNLYWVNRPKVSIRQNLTLDEATKQIEIMFNQRYPYMDIDKMMKYPFKCEMPEFSTQKEIYIKEQGNLSNCVVSNLFATFDQIDTLQNFADPQNSRNEKVRKDLMKTYSFYQSDFYPFLERTGFSLNEVWETFKSPNHSSI